MHFQMAPHEESKLVRCVRGAMYDVIVDIRPSSTTYRHWIAAELTADNGHALYIPGGFAHGFLTLEDDTEVFYHMSEFYHPQSSRGFRWDDATIQIQWPTRKDLIVSEKDKSLPSMEGLSL